MHESFNFIDFVALPLAVGGIVDCWFNGSIFEKWRKATSRWSFFQCAYCMSWQVSFWLTILFYLPSIWLLVPWGIVCKLPIYCLAGAYISWLVNEFRMIKENDYLRTSRAIEDMARYGGSTEEAEDDDSSDLLQQLEKDIAARAQDTRRSLPEEDATGKLTAAAKRFIALRTDVTDKQYTDFSIPTPEEAEVELDAAPDAPLTGEQINAMVESAISSRYIAEVAAEIRAFIEKNEEIKKLKEDANNKNVTYFIRGADEALQ